MYHAPIPVPTASLTPQDIEGLIILARSLVGITLTDRKAEFLAARLGRRLAANGLSDYAAYRRQLQNDPAERVAFTEALTTHTTSFFREKAQYDWLLAEGLPALSAGGALRKRDLVIWSAACSTGQEGYTALVVGMQARDRGLWDVNPRLIGTDVSRPVLLQAAQAVYSRRDIEGIPETLRQRFLLSSRKDPDRLRIVPELRALATWRQANLATGEGLDGIAADVVFLRNVLIYFDEEIRTRVIDNVFRRLRPGGYLLTGHTEASHARREGLEIVRPSIYRKVAR